MLSLQVKLPNQFFYFLFRNSQQKDVDYYEKPILELYQSIINCLYIPSEYIILNRMSVLPSQHYTDEVIEDFTHNIDIEKAVRSLEINEKIYQQEKKMENQEPNRFIKCVNIIVENLYFQIVISLITLCSLFMEDIRVIAFEKQFDEEIDAVHITFVTIFTIEILMSITIPGYLCSFFFYLDVFSTLSICMDISILTNLIYMSEGSGMQLSLIIRNSKASRAAARAVRVMKIFRLARIVKLYKSALQTKQIQAKKNKARIKQRLLSMKMKKNHQQQSDKNGNQLQEQITKNKMQASQEEPIMKKKKSKDQTESEDQIKTEEIAEDNLKMSQRQSKISKVLSDSTIKKVIILILLLMFSVPIFQISNYYQEENAWNFMINFVAEALSNEQIPLEHINTIIYKNINATQDLQVYDDIITFKTPFNELFSLEKGDVFNLRIPDMEVYEQQIDIVRIMENRPNQLTLKKESQEDLNSISIIINYRQFNQIDAWFSIGKTLAICIAVLYLLNVFNQSITRLIIEPIQKILNEILNTKSTDSFNSQNNNQTTQQAPKSKQSKAENYETVVIYNSIQKISMLLSRVYNLLGKQAIFKKILQNSSFQNSYLQQSKKCYCIFGLCTLENNHELASLLDEEYYQLMSEIAEQLHSSVYRYGGYPVSNYSKGLLVAFKYPKNFDENMDRKQNSIFADFSVFSMVKTIVKINKQTKFNKYRKNQKIIRQFESLEIKINCVMHAGWAYQGFYGSPYKLDYCFLGETIQQLEKLAFFCHKTSNHIYLSGKVEKMLTNQVRRLSRIVDEVSLGDDKSVKKCTKQKLYRVDLNLNEITPSKSSLNIHSREKTLQVGLKKQINMEYLRNLKEKQEYNAMMFINSKKQLREVLKNVVTEQYRKKYLQGYDYLIRNQWNEAKQLQILLQHRFQELMSFNKDDPILQFLYSQMQSHHFIPKQISPRPYYQCLIL